MEFDSEGDGDFEGVEGGSGRPTGPHVSGICGGSEAGCRGGERVGDDWDQVVDVGDGDTGQAGSGQQRGRIGCIPGGHVRVTYQRHDEIQQRIGHGGKVKALTHSIESAIGPPPAPKLLGDLPLGENPLLGDC